jgi:hypothetical protein
MEAANNLETDWSLVRDTEKPLSARYSMKYWLKIPNANEQLSTIDQSRIARQDDGFTYLTIPPWESPSQKIYEFLGPGIKMQHTFDIDAVAMIFEVSDGRISKEKLPYSPQNLVNFKGIAENLMINAVPKKFS